MFVSGDEVDHQADPLLWRRTEDGWANGAAGAFAVLFLEGDRGVDF